MTKINLFMNILFPHIAIILCAILQCSSALSDKRLCYDPACSVPISLARTSIKYNPNAAGLLSFDVNVEVEVYSKDAGKRNDLWGVKINGKHGYAPKIFLKEYKIIHKNLMYEVPINQIPSKNNVSNEVQQPKEDDSLKIIENAEPSNAELKSSDLKSTPEELPDNLNGVTPAYEVIDGTTVHLDPVDPPVTEVIKPTAVQNKPDVTDIKTGKEPSSEKVDPNNFRKKDELPKETSDRKDEDENQKISHKIDIKNYVSSSEEVSDLPKLTGIDVPLVGINTNREHQQQDKAENKITSDEPRVKDAQSSKESIDNSSTEASVTDQSTGTDAQDTTNTDVGNNIESVPPTKADKQAANEQSIKGVTNYTEATATAEESTGELGTNNISESEKNVSDLKTDQSTLKETEVPKEDIIKDNKHIGSSSPVKSKLEDTVILTLDQITVEENVSKSGVVEEILNDKPTKEKEASSGIENITSSELRSADVLENKEINLISDTTSVPSISNNDPNLTNNDSVTSISDNEIIKEELQKDIVQEMQHETQEHARKEISDNANDVIVTDGTLEKNTSDGTLEKNTSDVAETNETIVNINVNSDNDLVYGSSTTEVPIQLDEVSKHNSEKPDVQPPQPFIYPSHKNLISENILNINEFRNRNLLNVENTEQPETADKIIEDESSDSKEETLSEHERDISMNDTVLHESSNIDDAVDIKETTPDSAIHEVQVASPDVCNADFECANTNNNNDDDESGQFLRDEETSQIDKSAVISGTIVEHNYWLSLMYLSMTAATTLIFSLGYYYIENMRRDGKLIAKINKLEKDLLVSTKECIMLNENLKITKDKLTCIEDESFGSNEMVLSLKADLDTSQNIKAELEDQVAILEKDLESATEAGLELERMLREVLSSNDEVNPLAESVEDLQSRLNAQNAANESLTNALHLKTQENEALLTDVESLKKRSEELEVELTRVTENLKIATDRKNSIEKTLTDKVQQLEIQIKEISTEKATLQKEMKGKEVEMKDLVDVINQLNSNNLDLEKLYDVSRIKAEATAMREERDDLKVRLSEVEGAHSLLEEHMKVVKEELVSLSEQCKLAEKDKKDAETRLEVLSNFFKEKEAQRQKDEAVWLQKQGEVVSTVERIQTMQNEIQNYKQQIEILKHEILDQEREYKSQISLMETKAHEHWVVSRQVERRLEESKAEAAQLRNRLTMIEKNMNDLDPDTKLHRLEANGETATSSQLFMGAETSNSPIMFTGSSGVPPPPPHSYMHSLFPPYLPPPLPSASGVLPYEVGQRPPPLGGRLSSPPPMPLHPPPSSRYDNAVSSPPPMSPHLLPPFNHHRSPPPPFGSDHIHPPPPPPGSILPPPPLGTTHPWGEESLPLARTSGFHPHQREQRVRNHKGSLHSSGESLDKTHHSSNV